MARIPTPPVSGGYPRVHVRRDTWRDRIRRRGERRPRGVSAPPVRRRAVARGHAVPRPSLRAPGVGTPNPRSTTTPLPRPGPRRVPDLARGARRPGRRPARALRRDRAGRARGSGHRAVGAGERPPPRRSRDGDRRRRRPGGVHPGARSVRGHTRTASTPEHRDAGRPGDAGARDSCSGHADSDAHAAAPDAGPDGDAPAGHVQGEARRHPLIDRRALRDDRAKLARLNGIDDASLIRVGQVLQLP